MLYEIKTVRQVAGEGYRRWFRDNYFDLIVWYDDQEDNVIEGFQLCYDRQLNEHCVTWRNGYLTHDTVNEGERGWGSKKTPVLETLGDFDFQQPLAEEFFQASKDIDPLIRRYVYEKLKEHT